MPAPGALDSTPYALRGEIGDCLLCAVTDAPAQLRVTEIDPLAFG